MSDTPNDAGKPAPGKTYSKADVQEALAMIAEKVVESHAAYMHSMLFLDRLLRLPNAAELFDKDLRDQARDLWLKMKSAGLQLGEPPLLFPKQENHPTNGGE